MTARGRAGMTVNTKRAWFKKKEGQSSGRDSLCYPYCWEDSELNRKRKNRTKLSRTGASSLSVHGPILLKVLKVKKKNQSNIKFSWKTTNKAKSEKILSKSPKSKIPYFSQYFFLVCIQSNKHKLHQTYRIHIRTIVFNMGPFVSGLKW